MKYYKPVNPNHIYPAQVADIELYDDYLTDMEHVKYTKVNKYVNYVWRQSARQDVVLNETQIYMLQSMRWKK